MNISDDVKIIEVNEIPNYEFITNGDDEIVKVTFSSGDFIEIKYWDILKYIDTDEKHYNSEYISFCLVPLESLYDRKYLIKIILRFKNIDLVEEYKSCLCENDFKFILMIINRFDDIEKKIEKRINESEFNSFSINFKEKNVIASTPTCKIKIKYVFENNEVFNEFIAKLVEFGLENNLLGNSPDGKICSNHEFREKVEKSGLTQKEIAEKIGMSERGLRQILADELATTKRNHNYCQQFTVENLKPFLSLKVSNSENHSAWKSIA